MKFSFLLAGAFLAWGQQAAPPPADPAVITIGTDKITKSQFELILSSLPEQQRLQAQTGPGKRKLAEQLAELKTMAQEARREKLDQSQKAQIQMTLATDQLLATLLYQQLSATTKPDDTEVLAYYNAHKQDWDEVKARHILIRTPGSRVPLKPGLKELNDAEALAKTKEIREKILAGGDFSKLAQSESDDTGTAPNGGDLGTFGKGRMVPEFDKAAFALEIGKVSEPVKSPFGYHLILVESHAAKPLEAAKPEIEQKLKPELAQKGLTELKKKTPVVFDETYFGK